MELSPAERQLLLAHRLAVFDGCVVYDAQPPVSAEHVQRLAEGLAGPIPEDLLRLWRTCFGGRLGYDLEVDYDGHRHPFSFSELFYPDSDGYHDLWGWIEHERELAAEAATEEGRDWNGKLAYLPFGGFEYLERLYVCVEPGPEHGAVIAWSHGLPPAWAGRLHQDSVTRLADDVGGLFRLLSFEQDPFDAENACGVADELLEALDALEAAGEPGKALKAAWKSCCASASSTGGRPSPTAAWPPSQGCVNWPWPKLRKTATSTCCNACAMPAATSPKPCADAAVCWRPA